MRRLPVLRERPFALLFAGQAVSMVGDALSPVALATKDVRALRSGSAHRAEV